MDGLCDEMAVKEVTALTLKRNMEQENMLCQLHMLAFVRHLFFYSDE